MGLLAFVSLAQAVAPIINTLDATPVGPTYAVLNGSYDAYPSWANLRRFERKL